MRILTTRQLIRNVAEAWRWQYFDPRRDHWKHGEDKKEIYLKLKALNVEEAEGKDVEAIIGNKSWTTLYCLECKEAVDQVVTFDDGEVHLCSDCLTQASKKIKITAT